MKTEEIAPTVSVVIPNFNRMDLIREILEKAGPFNEVLKPSEDSELLLRILLAGAKLVHVPDTLVLYRLHPSNQISGSGLGA